MSGRRSAAAEGHDDEHEHDSHSHRVGREPGRSQEGSDSESSCNCALTGSQRTGSPSESESISCLCSSSSCCSTASSRTTASSLTATTTTTTTTSQSLTASLPDLRKPTEGERNRLDGSDADSDNNKCKRRRHHSHDRWAANKCGPGRVVERCRECSERLAGAREEDRLPPSRSEQMLPSQPAGGETIANASSSGTIQSADSPAPAGLPVPVVEAAASGATETEPAGARLMATDANCRRRRPGPALAPKREPAHFGQQSRPSVGADRPISASGGGRHIGAGQLGELAPRDEETEAAHADQLPRTVVVGCPELAAPAPTSAAGNCRSLTASASAEKAPKGAHDSGVGKRNLLSPMDFAWRPPNCETRALSCTEASLSNSIAAQLAAAVRSKSLCSETKILGGLDGRAAGPGASVKLSSKWPATGLGKRLGRLTRSAIKQIKRISLSNPSLERQQQLGDQLPRPAANYRYGELRRASSQRRPSARKESSALNWPRDHQDMARLAARVASVKRAAASSGGHLLGGGGDDDNDDDEMCVLPHQLSRFTTTTTSQGRPAEAPSTTSTERAATETSRLADEHDEQLFYSPGGVYIGPGGICSWQQVCPEPAEFSGSDEEAARADHCDESGAGLAPADGAVRRHRSALSWLPRPLRRGVAQALLGSGHEIADVSQRPVPDVVLIGDEEEAAACDDSDNRRRQAAAAERIIADEQERRAGAESKTAAIVRSSDDEKVQDEGEDEGEDEDEEEEDDDEERQSTISNEQPAPASRMSPSTSASSLSVCSATQATPTETPSPTPASGAGNRRGPSNGKIWIMNLTQRVSAAGNHSRLQQSPSSQSSGPQRQSSGSGSGHRTVIHASESTKSDTTSRVARQQQQQCKWKPPRLAKESRSNSLSGLFQRVTFGVVDLSKSSLELHRYDRRIVEQSEQQDSCAAGAAGDGSGNLSYRHSDSTSNDVQFQRPPDGPDGDDGGAGRGQTDDHLAGRRDDRRQESCHGGQQKLAPAVAETYGANLAASCVHCQLIGELSSHPQSGYLSQLLATPRPAAASSSSKPEPRELPAETNTTPVRPSVVLTVCSNQSTLDKDEDDDGGGEDDDDADTDDDADEDDESGAGPGEEDGDAEESEDEPTGDSDTDTGQCGLAGRRLGSARERILVSGSASAGEAAGGKLGPFRSASSVSSLLSRSSDEAAAASTANNQQMSESESHEAGRAHAHHSSGPIYSGRPVEESSNSGGSGSSNLSLSAGEPVCSSTGSSGSGGSLGSSTSLRALQRHQQPPASVSVGRRRASATSKQRGRKRRVKRRSKRRGSSGEASRGERQRRRRTRGRAAAAPTKQERQQQRHRQEASQRNTGEHKNCGPTGTAAAVVAGGGASMLEVPNNKQARSASLDANCLLKVPQGQHGLNSIHCDSDHDHDDCEPDDDDDDDDEKPHSRPNKSNRSRSVDISLPTKPGDSYIIMRQDADGGGQVAGASEQPGSGSRQQAAAAAATPTDKSIMSNNDKRVGEYFVDVCQLIEGRHFDLSSVQKKFIQGEVKVTCANGETRALKLFVDWSENCINGEHLWTYVGSSSEACYVGENECLKYGPRLCCSACKITAHTGCIGILIDKIKFICKHTYKDLTVNNPRHLKELQQQNVIYHHWVHKRTHCGRCKQCAKTFGNTKLPFSSKEIQAITCSWCKVSYHNKESCYTLSALTEPCTLGAHRESIIPPPWILKLPPNDNSQQAQNLIESADSVQLSSDGGHTIRPDFSNKENSDLSDSQRQTYCNNNNGTHSSNNNKPHTINRPQNFGSNTTLMTDTSGYMSAENSNVQSICSNTHQPGIMDNADQQQCRLMNNAVGASNERQNELLIDPTALQASDLSLINQVQQQQPRQHPQESMSQFQKHQLRQYYRQMDSSRAETNLRRDGDDGSVMMDVQLSQSQAQQRQQHQQTSFKQSGQGTYQNFKVVPQVVHGIPNAGSKPVLVFVNPRSGGNQGAKMMQKFNWLLNPRQVFDLIQSGGPRAALELYRDVPNLRILTIGGDGTASWILSYLDEKGIPNKIPVAVLPLGTGNDLARALGWGGGYADEPIAKILTQVRDGEVVQLDRWNLHVERNLEVAPSSPNEFSTSSVGCVTLDMSPPSLSSSPSYFGSNPRVTNSSSTISIIDQTTNCDTSMIQQIANNNPASSHAAAAVAAVADEAGSDRLPMDVINNYFSFGVDAHIALEFHTAREAHPERFNSRLRNKMFYGQAGGKDLLKRKWKDLSNFVKLYCDDHDMTGRLKELKVHSVLFLNIPSYGGGTRPWPTTATSSFAKPRTDDGLIEVIGLTTYQLPLLQAGGHGTCIAQCRSAKIITSRTIPMQVDGEPCKLLPSIINISFRNRVCMLAKSKNFQKNINMTNSNDRKY